VLHDVVLVKAACTNKISVIWPWAQTESRSRSPSQYLAVHGERMLRSSTAVSMLTLSSSSCCSVSSTEYLRLLGDGAACTNKISVIWPWAQTESRSRSPSQYLAVHGGNSELVNILPHAVPRSLESLSLTKRYLGWIQSKCCTVLYLIGIHWYFNTISSHVVRESNEARDGDLSE
jgi:hypothetical protein